jgi:hypothetical protein
MSVVGQSLHFDGRPATSDFSSTPYLSLHRANRRESRWLGIYDGLGLDHYSGRALLIGPTFYAKLNELYWVSAAWTVQVAGHAVARWVV